MGTAGSRSFSFALISGIAFAALLLPGRGAAYTPDQQQACTGDAFRLCGPEIPDVDRVTACMIARKAELSPGCRVFFRSGPEPVADAGAPMNIRPSARKHVAPKGTKSSGIKSSHKRKKPTAT